MTTTVTAAVGFDRPIQFGQFVYDHVLRDSRHDPSGVWSELLYRLRALDADRFLLVTEHSLLHPFGDEVLARIADAKVAPCAPISFPGSEQAKTLTEIDRLAGAARRAGATRASCLILLGGGLVGNVGGLLATLLYRGVRFVHLPMTLLGMLDSTPSLKQAVNSEGHKNLLGAFRRPEFVFADLAYLDTLPPQEIRSGLCEVIKNVLAICPQLLDEVAGLLNPDASYTRPQYRRFIELSIDAKCEVMADDPYEEKEGLRCEYGHSAGHAVEALTHRPAYRYGAVGHGHAVGIGMMVAARAARLLGLLDRADEAAHLDLLRRNGAPVTLPAGIQPRDVLNVVALDNKLGLLPAIPGHYLEVVLKRLGQPCYTAGRPLYHVPHQVLDAALRALTPAAQP